MAKLVHSKSAPLLKKPVSGFRTSSLEKQANEDKAWLTRPKWPRRSKKNGVLRGADIFSGCGGITMGLWEACRQAGYELEMAMACDLFPAAKKSYVHNFKPKHFLDRPIEQYVDGERPAHGSRSGADGTTGEVNVVVGGPPCQGNSTSTTTAWDDPRNELYMRMIRFVELFKPSILLIENVRDVVNNKQKVVPAPTTTRKLGYRVAHGVVKGEQIGVPQTRADTSPLV